MKKGIASRRQNNLFPFTSFNQCVSEGPEDLQQDGKGNPGQGKNYKLQTITVVPFVKWQACGLEQDIILPMNLRKCMICTWVHSERTYHVNNHSFWSHYELSPRKVLMRKNAEAQNLWSSSVV